MKRLSSCNRIAGVTKLTKRLERLNEIYKIELIVKILKMLDLRRITTVLLGCVATICLYMFLLIVPLHQAVAASLEKDSTAKLIEEAKKEGKLSWYATMDVPDAEKIMNRFRGMYPFIEATIYRTGDQAMVTRILTEARAKKYLYDVVHIPVLNAEILKRKGLFAKYLSPERKFYPEGARDPEGYWTSIYLNIHAPGYNTKLISPGDVPKTYEDFLHPRWKEKIGMDDKAFYWFAAVIKMMGEDKGLAYMRKLSDQNIHFRTGKTVVTEMVVAGELSVGLPLFNHRVEEMKGKGAPIEWVALEPVIPDINPIGISANAPHPSAARLFVDFILSREGQEVIASLYRIPNRTDVDPIVARLKKGLKIMPFDASIVDDYEKYVKLYREILMKKGASKIRP